MLWKFSAAGDGVGVIDWNGSSRSNATLCRGSGLGQEQAPLARNGSTTMPGWPRAEAKLHVVSPSSPSYSDLMVFSGISMFGS